MASKSNSRNGYDRLDEAMVLLLRNRATYSDQRGEFARQWDEQSRKSAEQFVRIEEGLANILRILEEQLRMLERMPDAICEKLGFNSHG